MGEDEKQLTTQEVNSLRKSGELDAALGHARRLYERNANDPWIVRTLFWCLYDEFKRVQAAKSSDAISAVTKEVESLKLPDEESDQVMHDCAARILGAAPVAKATQLSKTGNHRDAVALLRTLAKGEGVTSVVGEAYGWVLYRKLRDGGSEEANIAIWCLDEFLNSWSTDWEPNVILFKCMLIQAKKHAEGWAGFVQLVEKLGLHRLRAAEFVDDRPDADYEPFQDQLLTSLHKCLKKYPELQVPRPALHQLLAEWKEDFGDDKFQHYHLGHILHWTGGEEDEARIHLLKAVQSNTEDYWRWTAFAETLAGAEKKAALSSGILCNSPDPSFKVPSYKEYAELLATEGELPAAKASLEEAMRLRQLSGKEWREPIPVWFDQIAESGAVDIHQYAEPFAATTDEMLAADLPARLCILIRPLEKERRFLFLCPDAGTRTLKFRPGQLPPAEVGAIEAQFEDKEGGICIVLAWKKAEIPASLGVSEIGVVDHVNAEKRLASVATLTQEFVPLYFDRWKKASQLQSGMFVGLQCLNQQDSKPLVLKWALVAPKLVPGFAIPVKGRFERARDRAFGFIEMEGRKIFVPPDQAKDLQHSSQATGWAIRSSDKHGRPSWKLLPKQS